MATKGKELIIVESPHKAQTIGKFLGPGYIVMSSKGHIRDLPPKRLGIDIEGGFKPDYEIPEASKKVVASLKTAAKTASAILLASDPDREGEAIAWHLYEVLAPVAAGKSFRRIQYNEITPRAVKAALANPVDIDRERVNAQQARRLIDRIVGYKVSPFIWRNVKGGSSAGRVQSVALRLVCEREDEILRFTPVPYWITGLFLKKGELPPFFAKLAKINGEKAEITTEEAAKRILSELGKRRIVVESVSSKDIVKRPPPPFITSSLQRAASGVLGFTPGRTMSVAQKLYEGIDIGGSDGPIGLITYMRTDAPAVSKEAQDATLQFIEKNYGAPYRPQKPNIFKSGAKAQEAHEAIRPTDVARTPASLSGKLDPAELKLYDLIWRRFVASQMSGAELRQKTVLFDAESPSEEANADKYTFSSTSTDVVFPGFTKVMELDLRRMLAAGGENKDAEGAPQEEDDEEEGAIPELALGEELDIDGIKSERKETKPPSRYSEAMLIDTLEKNGIGRPSTYASIMETIIKHGYVTRERKTLFPTDLGKQVVSILVGRLPSLFEVGFTAQMESELDRIEAGEVDWIGFMDAFYSRFSGWMAEAKEPPAETATVAKVIKKLSLVKEWLPPEKRGRYTYDDRKLFDSINKQLTGQEKPISAKQLGALASMLWRYRAQIEGAKEFLTENNLGDAVKSDNPETPPQAIEKLELLLAAPLGESQKRFVSSLHSQCKSGRNLTQRQIDAIDNVLASALPLLDNADAVAEKYGIKPEPQEPVDNTEAAELVSRLSAVTEWKPAVKRGKRVFDDSAFFASVKKQFEASGTLSAKQIASLRKLAARYASGDK